MGRFLPADHSKGDANTVGGYTLVHSRPPAFEGRDGVSYSVEVMTDDTGDSSRPYAGYLLFVRWRSGDPVASGHLESQYLIYANTEKDAHDRMGAMQLNDALAELNKLIGDTSRGSRPWWEVMHDETGE